jgi:hypothetical protein
MASLTIRKSKTLRPSRLERLLLSLAVKRWGLFKVLPACHFLNTYSPSWETGEGSIACRYLLKEDAVSEGCHRKSCFS